jgi:hypothetical protein
MTLELSAELMRQVREQAAATNRRPEGVVADWIERAAADPAVETLPDAQVLALCDSELPTPSRTRPRTRTPGTSRAPRVWAAGR